MLVLDDKDNILNLWMKGTNAIHADRTTFYNYPVDFPIAFRGMTKKDVVDNCKATGRKFYYIDTGYLGNLGTFKTYHRVVENDVQHTSPIDLPNNRFNELISRTTKSIYSKKWRNTGSKILVVTPSEKPCNFYGINRDDWVKTTINTLENYTDREIIVRDKPTRKDRIGEKSIYSQFILDDVYAVVTYNSIAATEAVAFGIPAFADAPVNAAKTVCSNDFTKIETPFYPEREQVDKWLHWLAYCQYTEKELKDGTAYKIQKEYNLC
jgi:hypothetical protein